MNDKTQTVGDLQASYGEKASSILQGYHGKLDNLRYQHLDASAIPVELNFEQKRNLLREQRTAKAQEARQEALSAYSSTTEQHLGEVEARKEFLKERLFSLPGELGAEALSRAATASDEQLASLLDIGIKAGNADLSRAAFVAAEQRGAGDLMLRYYEQDPDAQDLYAEFREAPSDEQLERKLEQAETFLPAATNAQLMPPGQVG